MERLQKILARHGIASRRAAEELIRQGRIRVDGRVVTEMGLKADPDSQVIECDGKPLRQEEKKVYYLLNKPTGYVTTVKDPEGRDTVLTLLEKQGVRERVFPVGRLDKDTEGALIMTNDGDLAQKVQHPSFEVKKTYVAVVTGLPAEEKLEALRTGIVLEGRPTSPAEITLLGHDSRTSTIQVTIHEGRKRQVRKMFDAIGHRVKSLQRTAYGGLLLGDLKPGRFRVLSRKDLAVIFTETRKRTKIRKKI